MGLIGIGGGGSAEYPNGLQQIDASLKLLGPIINGLYTSLGLGAPFGPVVVSKFSGSSAVYGAQTSVAFALMKDKLGLSIGYRFEYGDSVFKGKIYSPGGAYGGYIPMGSEFHASQKGAGPRHNPRNQRQAGREPRPCGTRRMDVADAPQDCFDQLADRGIVRFEPARPHVQGQPEPGKPQRRYRVQGQRFPGCRLLRLLLQPVCDVEWEGEGLHRRV